MTHTIPKRGDVLFCQGSPAAIGSEERKTRPDVIIQNDEMCIRDRDYSGRKYGREACRTCQKAL